SNCRDHSASSPAAYPSFIHVTRPSRSTTRAIGRWAAPNRCAESGWRAGGAGRPRAAPRSRSSAAVASVPTTWMCALWAATGPCRPAAHELARAQLLPLRRRIRPRDPEAGAEDRLLLLRRKEAIQQEIELADRHNVRQGEHGAGAVLAHRPCHLWAGLQHLHP